MVNCPKSPHVSECRGGLFQTFQAELFIRLKTIPFYIHLYQGAVKCLNLIGWRTFWGVQLFSGKRMANVVPGSSLDSFHFAKWFLLFQRSYNRKITKTHNDTGQTNEYSNQTDKIDSSCFCNKIQFYHVCKAHRSLPHRRTYSLHTP